jgi:hypothetical protein
MDKRDFTNGLYSLVEIIENLDDRIKEASEAPAILLKLQKKILATKARLASVENEYKKAKEAAITRAKKDADVLDSKIIASAKERLAKYSEAIEALPMLDEVIQYHGIARLVVEKKVELGMLTSAIAAAKDNPYCRALHVAVTNEAKEVATNILKDAASRADKLYIKTLIEKAASQPVTGDAPEQ